MTTTSQWFQSQRPSFILSVSLSPSLSSEVVEEEVNSWDWGKERRRRRRSCYRTREDSWGSENGRKIDWGRERERQIMIRDFEEFLCVFIFISLSLFLLLHGLTAGKKSVCLACMGSSSPSWSELVYFLNDRETNVEEGRKRALNIYPHFTCNHQRQRVSFLLLSLMSGTDEAMKRKDTPSLSFPLFFSFLVDILCLAKKAWNLWLSLSFRLDKRINEMRERERR